MNTLMVTRHPGARAWARRYRLPVDRFVDHLDPADLQPGDRVIGTLPIHLAAEVCQHGGMYLHLAVDLPRSARGRELSADELERYGARLTRYHVVRTDDTAPTSDTDESS